MNLSPRTIEIVKEITPLVAEHAETVTRRFYELMFAGHPEVRAYFNPAHQHSGGQQRALAGAICAYFSHIDNLDALVPAVELIAQKHCSLGVAKEHYPIVGEHLLAAIREVMGEAATDEVMEAVAEAYGVLAEVCIGRERAIYAEQASAEGGWNGYREFEVTRKAAESEEVTSLYLEPTDGGGLPEFLPGQYLTVKVEDGVGGTALRNYSLSDRPGVGHFRISVKRERGLGAEDPAGVVSSYLHDEVKVGSKLWIGPPCGEFTLQAEEEEDASPAVFLAGGIGVTPLLSMVKSLVAAGSPRPVWFVQAARHGGARAFAEELETVRSEGKRVETRAVFDEPRDDDELRGRCDAVGRVDARLLESWGVPLDGAFYVCGPAAFMGSVLASLQELGVDDERVHYEFFGPRQAISTTA